MEEKPKLWSHQPDEGGRTALHCTAYCQDLANVAECIEGGFDVGMKDEPGQTPPAWCVNMAATDGAGAAEPIIDYLVAHGARLESSDVRNANIVEFARASDENVTRHIEKLLAN